MGVLARAGEMEPQIYANSKEKRNDGNLICETLRNLQFKGIRAGRMPVSPIEQKR